MAESAPGVGRGRAGPGIGDAGAGCFFRGAQVWGFLMRDRAGCYSEFIWAGCGVLVGFMRSHSSR
jgi:hypothetical protein